MYWNATYAMYYTNNKKTRNTFHLKKKVVYSPPFCFGLFDIYNQHICPTCTVWEYVIGKIRFNILRTVLVSFLFIYVVKLQIFSCSENDYTRFSACIIFEVRSK